MDTRLNSRNTCSLTNENKSMPEILWKKLKERESLKLNYLIINQLLKLLANMYVIVILYYHF